MIKKNYKDFIFDLDGTLIDSSEDIIVTLQTAIKEANMEPSIRIDKSIIGPPLREMIKKIVFNISEEKLSEIQQNFRRIYDNSEYPKTKLYNNVKETLMILKNNNKQLYIATNKPEIPTKKIIKNLSIDIFDDIVCIDTINGKNLNKIEMVSHIINKHNLKVNDTIMIGDSLNDYEAAKENNIEFIAVCYDSLLKSSFLSYNIKVVDNIKDIFQYVTI